MSSGFLCLQGTIPLALTSFVHFLPDKAFFQSPRESFLSPSQEKLPITWPLSLSSVQQLFWPSCLQSPPRPLLYNQPFSFSSQHLSSLCSSGLCLSPEKPAPDSVLVSTPWFQITLEADGALGSFTASSFTEAFRSGPSLPKLQFSRQTLMLRLCTLSETSSRVFSTL